jgi:hypothetical protein
MQIRYTPPTSFSTPAGTQVNYTGGLAVSSQGVAGAAKFQATSPQGAAAGGYAEVVAVPGMGTSGQAAVVSDLNGDGTLDRGAAAQWSYTPEGGGSLTLASLNGGTQTTRTIQLPPRPAPPV